MVMYAPPSFRPSTTGFFLRQSEETSTFRPGHLLSPNLAAAHISPVNRVAR